MKESPFEMYSAGACPSRDRPNRCTSENDFSSYVSFTYHKGLFFIRDRSLLDMIQEIFRCIAIVLVPRLVKRELYHIIMEKRPVSFSKETYVRFKKNDKEKTYVISEKFHMYSDFTCPSVCHQKRPISYHDGKETSIICKRDLYQILKKTYVICGKFDLKKDMCHK